MDVGGSAVATPASFGLSRWRSAIQNRVSVPPALPLPTPDGSVLSPLPDLVSREQLSLCVEVLQNIAASLQTGPSPLDQASRLADFQLQLQEAEAQCVELEGRLTAAQESLASLQAQHSSLQAAHASSLAHTRDTLLQLRTQDRLAKYLSSHPGSIQVSLEDLDSLASTLHADLVQF